MSQDIQMFEIEATVVSGLEEVARDEVEEVLKAQIYEVKQGRVNFLLHNMREALNLRSVDNMHLIVHRSKNIEFPQNLDDCMMILKSLVKEVNWKEALQTWRDFVSEENPTGISDIPSYRVTCKRVGEHCFESPHAATHFGGAVNDHVGWRVDLSNFDVEVMLMIIHNEVKVGIALTKESLHRRNIVNFGQTTLKPTIAHGILWNCKIEPGDIVCDPLCGSGSIPLESVASHQGTFNLCGDISSRLVLRTLDNWKSFVEKKCGRNSQGVDIVRWNSCHLPLKDNSIDVIASDLPFGKRVGSKKDNWDLYPRILSEFARVTRRSSGRACLLTQDKKCIVKSLAKVSSFWKRGPTTAINIGGLVAHIYVLYRTPVEFQRPKL